MGEVDADVSDGSVVVAAAVVDMAVAEMPRSNMRKCVMPSTEAFSKSGASFMLDGLVQGG
jgi:hypothetical protein